MELSPELEKSIKTSLSRFMDEDDAGHFMNLSYVTSLVKQEQPPWQALVSVGVYAAELYLHQDTDAEKTILQELVSQALTLPREEVLKLVESEEAHIWDLIGGNQKLICYC